MTIQAAQDGTWLEAAEEVGAVVVVVVVVAVGRCPPRGALHLPHMTPPSLYGNHLPYMAGVPLLRGAHARVARRGAPQYALRHLPNLATTCLIWQVRDRTIRWAYGAASAELGAEHASSLVTVLEKVIRSQSDDNQMTIRSQSDGNQMTIRSQSDHNQMTIRSQSDRNQIAIR